MVKNFNKYFVFSINTITLFTISIYSKRLNMRSSQMKVSPKKQTATTSITKNEKDSSEDLKSFNGCFVSQYPTEDQPFTLEEVNNILGGCVTSLIGKSKLVFQKGKGPKREFGDSDGNHENPIIQRYFADTKLLDSTLIEGKNMVLFDPVKKVLSKCKSFLSEFNPNQELSKTHSELTSIIKLTADLYEPLPRKFQTSGVFRRSVETHLSPRKTYEDVARQLSLVELQTSLAQNATIEHHVSHILQEKLQLEAANAKKEADNLEAARAKAEKENVQKFMDSLSSNDDWESVADSMLDTTPLVKDIAHVEPISAPSVLDTAHAVPVPTPLVLDTTPLVLDTTPVELTHEPSVPTKMQHSTIQKKERHLTEDAIATITRFIDDHEFSDSSNLGLDFFTHRKELLVEINQSQMRSNAVKIRDKDLYAAALVFPKSDGSNNELIRIYYGDRQTAVQRSRKNSLIDSNPKQENAGLFIYSLKEEYVSQRK